MIDTVFSYDSLEMRLTAILIAIDVVGKKSQWGQGSPLALVIIYY